MKNLKKIAALVIVLAMALSSVAFGAVYTDVAEDASYNEAVTVMSALGLLKGYEDGTFGPDKTITRAEFATVIVRALGMEDAAAGAVANTIFTDVTASHWAAGYIQIANQKGIIAGYGDGTFGPEDEVTYEQAVKMIVCALGYGIKFAEDENAYPSAYLSQANTSGITVGATGKIGEKATRAIVSKLVYNALDVKLMEQSTFGTTKEWTEQDKTLLSNNLNVAKVDATVETLYFDPDKADKVKIDATAKKIYAEAMDAMNGDEIDNDVIDRDYYYVDGITLEKGYNCVAYIDISGDEDDWTILAMVPKSGKNATLTLTGIQTKDTTKLATVVEEEEVVGLKDFTYFKTNADEDTSETKIKVEEDVKIYVNKNADALVPADDYEDFVDSWKAGDYKEITLLDTDSDNEYNYIYVTEYKSFVVTEIVEKKYRVKGENNGSSDYIVLDPEDEEDIFTIKDAAGNELAFADIKVGDVVNYFVSESDDNKLTEVVITDDKVEGTVTEWNSITGKYTIGSDSYYGLAGEFKVSDTGVFTIDMYGTIIDYSIDASNRKFGMLYGIYTETSAGDNETLAVILTSDGKFVTYDFASSATYNSYEKKNAAYYAGIAEDGVITADPVLAMYTLNSSNEIKEIYTGSNIESIEDDYTLTEVLSDKEYDATTEELGSYAIVDSSLILTCKEDELTTEKTDYSASSKDMFAEKEDYKYQAVVNEDDEIIVAMIFNAAAQVDKTSLAMYVTSVGDTTDSEGEDAIRVKGYVDGELVSIVVTEDTDGISDFAEIEVGSMIQYSGEGEALAVKVLVTVAQMANVDEFEEVKSEDGEKEDYYAYAGKVTKYVKNKIYFEDGKTVNFDSGIAAMLVRVTTTLVDEEEVYSAKVYANGIYAGDIETEESIDGEPDDYIIIYKYDNDAIGAVIVDVNGDTEI